MAPLDDLYAALQISNEQKKAISDSNPYTPAANIFGQLGTTIATSGPQYSMRDKLIYGALSGLFGGALTGMAQRRDNNAQTAYMDVVRRGLAGETNIQQPDELPSGLFQSALQQKDLALFKRSLDQRAREEDLIRDLRKTTMTNTIEKAIENPRLAAQTIDVGMNALGALTGKKPIGEALTPQPKLPAVSLDPETQKLIDERNAIADMTDSGFANKVMEQRAKALEDAAKSQLEASGENYKMVDSLRKEIIDLPEVKKFKEVSDRYSVLKNAITDPTSISDLDFIYGVAKILDPTSVVRETEAGMVIDSQSIEESTLGRLNKYLTGGGALSPSQRVDMLRLANRHYTTLGNKILDVQSAYSKLAKNRNLNIEELGLRQPFRSSIPSESGARSQFLANLASRFPPTEEGRAAFKEAVRFMEQ